MANSILRSSRHIKLFHALSLFSLSLLIQRVSATEFKVGSSNGWAVPTDANAPSYNQWAEKNRFQIGDSLLFVYTPEKDSVLQVNKDDYTNCNTGQPIALFNDGHTSFKFNQSGPYYFISGIVESCLKNEKMVVVVLADRSGRLAPPSPPPSTETGPSQSPVETPAPVGEESPSPPSGASSMFVSFVVSSIGAFLGSSLLLVM
ncbi:PREDICTED: early nodulin-like protein 3 [Nelumbo nucifera]|uniref:Phytocyanin domain-containing protein n=2 Tax=Nelumbo nucifera TaxID=4432 RepID=A0A822XNP3_NELNU|nr:PREDICTED: early nodulin-like protein 3 [Nelumbo nucifera]DAD20556.1 TPA_asm: hypothetical protein HUJ06_022019 [Nelumbo nucifera]